MEETRTVHITCPACHQEQDVAIPLSVIVNGPETGLVTVSFKSECGHACQVFIDKKYKVRGGQCADISLDDADIQVESISQDMLQVGEIVLRFAMDVIKQDIEDAELIESISAQEKIDHVENALIRGDVRKAMKIFTNLRKFVKEIGEEKYAKRIDQQLNLLNKLIDKKVGFDWDSIILRDYSGVPDDEFSRARALHYERLRQVMAELEYQAIQETLSREAVEQKKMRLLGLIDSEE